MTWMLVKDNLANTS